MKPDLDAIANRNQPCGVCDYGVTSAPCICSDHDPRVDLWKILNYLNQDTQISRANAADTMRFLIPSDFGYEEWADADEDLPAKLAALVENLT